MEQRNSKIKRRRSKKVCYFTANKIEVLDYKDTKILSRFITDRGKIVPKRNSGLTAKWQRKVANNIKKATLKTEIKDVDQQIKTVFTEAELNEIYHEKIVDLKASAKKARETIWSVRKGSDFKKIAKDVYLKHGSRLRRA